MDSTGLTHLLLHEQDAHELHALARRDALARTARTGRRRRRSLPRTPLPLIRLLVPRSGPAIAPALGVRPPRAG